MLFTLERGAVREILLTRERGERISLTAPVKPTNHKQSSETPDSQLKTVKTRKEQL
jgi:hypothetical protein